MRRGQGLIEVSMFLRRAPFTSVFFFAMLGSVTSEAQTIFTSIPPQAFVVEQLAGDLISIEVFLPPGASPATYEPTPRQMAALDEADLYLQIGAPFEGPILAKIEEMMPGLKVVDCRQGVELSPMDSAGHHHGDLAFDPHIWLDPQRMKIVATTTAEALESSLPTRASLIADRLSLLLDSIDAADRRVAEILAPHGGRTVLVFHPAYGYFTRRYGLIQVAIEKDGKAPSARRMAGIVDELGKQRVPALFVQPQFSRSTAERVARALDCELVELDPLARDYLNNLESMALRIAEGLK
jgi:zinc transport system substrate-binding protein